VLIVGYNISRLYRLETEIAETKSSMYRLNYLIRTLFASPGFSTTDLRMQVSEARIIFDQSLANIDIHPLSSAGASNVEESIAITRQLWSSSEANIQEIESILSELAESRIDQRRGLDISLMEYNSMLKTTDVKKNRDHYYIIRGQNLIDSVIIESDTYSQILYEASAQVAKDTRNRIRLLTFIMGASLTIFGTGVLIFALNFSREALVEKVNNLLEEVTSRENDKRIFQMKMLRYQINPHFLFNTLNSVRYTSLQEGAKESAEMIRILSRLLRNTVSTDEVLVPIRSEIANINDYMSLMKKRYGDRLGFTVNCDELTQDNLIPPFLIQPLLENAILHGLSAILNEANKNAQLLVDFTKSEVSLIVHITDNGIGMDHEMITEILLQTSERGTHHIGMKNIHDRLRLGYGPPYGLNIDSSSGEGTTVSIILPNVMNEKGTL
ncbi:MAG: histidine kinase, partial [Spirochaetaceae bacterium]|nr:histidine kinase [Spirochaetaceae bacterium]